MADLVVQQPKLVNPFDEGITSPLTTGIGRASEDSLRQGLVGAWCPSLTVTKSQLLPDLSGYGNNGTLNGINPSTGWVASDKKLALNFNGTDNNIISTIGNAQQPKTQISLCGWVYVITGKIAQKLFSLPWTTGTLPPPYVSFCLNCGTDATSLRAGGALALTGAGGDGLIRTNDNAALNLSANTWNHICMTYDGTLLRMFVNGSEPASAVNTSGTIRYNGIRTLTFGMNDPLNFADQRLIGYLDDCRIYNRALTPSEIQRLYSGGRGYGLRKTKTKVFSVAAPSSFTASGVVTTGAATCSGSATFTTPVYTGTSTVTIAAATCSASGTFTKPVYSATSSVTIAAASCSATGTFIKPVYLGTSTLTVGHATASGAATFVAPVYTASASVAVGATVVNVAGSVVVPTYTAAAAVSVGAAVGSGTASNNFVAGPYRVAARQVFVPGAVAFQVRTAGASAAQVF